MSKEFNPLFRTSEKDLSEEEVNKRALGLRGSLKDDLRDMTRPDIAWESEQIAKSHGIYLEFNRALTGQEKDWIYMIRISIPGGGPINARVWSVFDELSEKYGKDPRGNSSLRLTTRQNIQFHWIKKPHVVEIVRRIAEAGFYGLNGCGDNTRNMMACPCSGFNTVFNGNAWAHKTAEYFQLPHEPFLEIFGIDSKSLRKPEESFLYGPQLLNRKFKIAFSSIYEDPSSGKLLRDNCVELRTNDIGVAPLIENGKFNNRFQIYAGGGQGERNGKPSAAMLGLPFGIVEENNLLPTLDAIVKVHQEWGDRSNRHWARLKYVIKKMGVDWYRDRVHEIVSFKVDLPRPDYDYGARQLHFGWAKQPSNGLWMFGTFIETGRITDASPNGRLKTMMREILSKYKIEFMVTPNQDVLFINIPETAKKSFESDLKAYGWGTRNGKPYSALRLHSGACVGRDTCRLTYTDSEKFEPELIDELEKLGWGDLRESIGITGCERQCFRPSTKSVGVIGTGLDRYQIRLMGAEDARHQGLPIMDTNGIVYLRSIPPEKVSVVIDALLKNYMKNRKENETLGYFHRRLEAKGIIEYLRANASTAELMAKQATMEYLV